MMIMPPARVTSRMIPFPNDGIMKSLKTLINPESGFHPAMIVAPTQTPRKSDNMVFFVTRANIIVMIGGIKHKIPKSTFSIIPPK